MPARFTILCGPAWCGKTERLLARYRDALQRRPPGTSLWLSPNKRAMADVRGRLLDATLAGCFTPNVMTFGNFAEKVLREARLPIRPVTRSMKRQMIRQIIAEQSSRGRLRHFRSIAKTSGLVDLLCEFIGELKRREIWPEEFHRACATRGTTDKDVELFEIYDAYQQALREHGLFDAEGRFWSARDVLRKAEGGVVSGQWSVASEEAISKSPNPQISKSSNPPPSLVVVDGFTDFTRTQHEILDILAQRAEEMFVALPLEGQPRRADLFAKPIKTLDQLRRRHPGAVIKELPPPANPTWPAMAHLERTLFENPRDKRADPCEAAEGSGFRVQGSGFRVQGSEFRVQSSGFRVQSSESTFHQNLNPEPRTLNPPALGIEILAAARQVGEMEMIAARIKRLLVDGQARPGEIAVVFRSPEEIGELVGEVFGRLGIPVAIESGHALHRWPVLRALATLLQLELDDWPFDRLLAVLGSNYFQPDWPEWRAVRAATIEQTIRGLQIPRGHQRLIEQLAAESGATLAVVKRLADAFDALPERATLPDWAKAWRRLAEETGLLQAMNGCISDRLAWDRLMEVLAEGDTLAAWLQQRSPELDRRAAFEALLDIVDGDRVGHSGDESGQVRVLSAAGVRSLRVPYLFLAGLSEKAFPPPDREDRLYSEAECLRLIDAGLPLVARSERTREEMLLFYEAVTRATKRLYLSYPALDEAAQPLLSSPFLSEVEQAFGPGRIPRAERTDFSPIPPDDEPLCEAEFRVKAVATALEGNVALLAGLMQGPGIRDQGSGIRDQGSNLIAPLSNGSLIPSLAAGLELIHLRQDRQRFGPAEGVLQGQAAHYYLAVRFPPQHPFAATDLERYASCPFRFLLERVLEIKPVEDLALEFDVLSRGRVAHDVLATFHRRVNDRLGRPGSPLELDASEFDSLLAAAVEDSLPGEPANPLRAALREVDRRLVVEWLAEYRGQLEKYEAQWKDFEAPMAAELFEVSFGRGDESPPSVERSLEFVRGGQAFHVSGRIDRIDTGRVAGKKVFNVLDYKTGGPIPLTPETVKAGTTLQLPLYVLATAELLLTASDAVPWRAGYWYVRQGGFKPRQALRMYCNQDGGVELEPAWEELRTGLGDTVAALVGAIRGGRFPACSTDDRCTGRCPFSTVCRINQVRSLEKTCQPTRPE